MQAETKTVLQTTDIAAHLLYSSAKRMMRNSHYLGDDFYPAIIDKESFDAVEA